MPAMKVTTDAAMRARDVSRPHAEHLAWAEEVEAGTAAAAGGFVEETVPAETDAVVDTGVVAEMNVAVEADVAAEAMAVGDQGRADGPRSDGPRSDGPRLDGPRLDGPRRRRVRGIRSSSRRGRPFR